MKKAICMVWLVSILAQSSVRLGWMAYFYLNQSRIAATLCENRDKPDLHCDGKCYLRKKLAATEQVSSTKNTAENAPVFPPALSKLPELMPADLPVAPFWAVDVLDEVVFKVCATTAQILSPQPYCAAIFKPPSRLA